MRRRDVVPQGFAHAATLHQEDLFIREDLLAGEYALNQVNFLSFRNKVIQISFGCGGSLVWM
jgi:hypothetical protein